MSKGLSIVEKIDSLGSPNIGKHHEFIVSLRYYATYVPEVGSGPNERPGIYIANWDWVSRLSFEIKIGAGNVAQVSGGEFLNFSAV